jgi:hypothetical protein
LLGIGAVAAWFVVALAAIGAGLYVSGHAFAADPSDARAIELLPAAVAALLLLTVKPYGHGWVQPGPRLIRGEQPELFAAIDSAAEAVGAKRFDEVYLDGSAEARVLQRDGAFGIGGRRTLVLGSALLEALSVDHVKALVAYEAFLNEGGSDKFAALVERSRARMRRGLDEIAGDGGGLTSLPFGLYAGFFMDATAALAQSHKRDADAAVAQALGAQPLAEVFQAIPGLPAARDMYARSWSGRGGPRFAEFLTTDDVDRAMRFALFQRIEQSAKAADEPPLQERLGALTAVASDAKRDDRPASATVDAFDQLARRVGADWSATRTA